ncbi:hypothetical protein [Sciscionella sediminilitoris]|uniref:hypothetical protein n=1 Tax=Sciscionella sediminilitoris TaxID=1445613 RepID=UPI000A8F9ABE|nr:hypothetical protein [Sciscionella sp. SE31]
MYAWIWRHLPGPLAVRVLCALGLVLGIIALLLFVIFPAVDPLLPFNDVTID